MNEKDNTLAENDRSLLINSLRNQFSIASGEQDEVVNRALIASDYLGHQLESRGASLLDDIEQAVDDHWCRQQLDSWYQGQQDGVQDDRDPAMFLRRFRHHAMVRIIARMANARTNCEQTIAEVSRLAHSCIEFAAEYCHRRLCAAHGIPRNSSGQAQQLLVIAMGKLGGMELNLSSDIDLIFVYGEDGSTDGSDRVLTNHGFFTRLGQQMIRLLSEHNEEGFVFRVDMRLRPYGSSGALVASFAELEKYYFEQARQWERFALARACVITGDARCRERLEQMIAGYVYRQYVDFSVIESLRSIKQDIRRVALRDDNNRNIKLGAGGIREIEFIAQTYQLIYGGKHYGLRSASTRAVLRSIADEGLLDRKVINQLDRSYLFLRAVENYIQASRDQQTHSLPTDEVQQSRLALAMGYSRWQQLGDDCERHRELVRSVFDDLVLGEQEHSARKVHISQEAEDYSNALFDEKHPESGLVGDDARQRLEKLIAKINKSSEEAQTLCRQLVPCLLDAAGQTEQSDLAVIRLCDLADAIIRRPVYLNLLNENRSIVVLLSHALVISNWIYQQLCQYPALLESFIHVQGSVARPSRNLYFDRLRSSLSGLAEDDSEQQITAMRHFARESFFQVALRQVMNSLPLPRVSDALTYTAEACIEQALHLAWKHLSERHGVPSSIANSDDPQASGFAVIAYGKLGSLELNYTSDLDLVFVYSGAGSDTTDGNKPIPLVQFYTRVAQRIIHLLTTPTSAGGGYRLDTRLRPQGSKGLLVNSTDGLADYLLQEAWTWEHQALTRARPIAGDRETIASFLKIRQQALCREREPVSLAREIWSMREKIDNIKQDSDIKYGAGGLVDIEFLVQFLVLAYASEQPTIIKNSDNMRQLEALARVGVISQQQQNDLINAYITLRSATHYIALGIDDHGVDIHQQTDLVQRIQASFREP